MLPFQKLVSQPFPKIICIGKNYLKHVKEMGGATVPTSPVIFIKPWSSLNYAPESLSLPIAGEHRIDHELQLGVLIGKGGTKIEKSGAMSHVGGYFLGIDFTDRDQQNHAKSQGLPWALSKGQDNFCPVSPMLPEGVDPYSVELELKVNGVTRQKDSAGHMHFKIDQLICYTSQFITLIQGDLILTGTPEGVGGVQIGDKIQAYGRVNDHILATLQFTVTK